MERKTPLKDMETFILTALIVMRYYILPRSNMLFVLHAADSISMKTLNPRAKWYEVDKLKIKGTLMGYGERFWTNMGPLFLE